MSFLAEFLRSAKRYVVRRHTTPKSPRGNRKQVVSPITPHDFSLQPSRDASLDSRWCTGAMGPRRIYLPTRRCGAFVSGVSLGTKLKQVWVAILVFAIGLLCAGCGTGMTVVAMMSPSISQVSPQVVTAGTPSVTVTVQGTNFQSQAALTVNGNAVPTTVVNSTTIAANIGGTTLAQPAVQQLQVRNSDGAQSNQVALTV